MTTATILMLIVAVIIASMMTFFQYFYKSRQKKEQTILPAILRFLAIFSILVLLIDPKISIKQLEEILPTLNIAIDNSSSMADSGQSPAILDLIDQIKTNKELGEKFEINYFKFSDKLELLDSLNFNGAETNVLSALSRLDAISKGKIAPIVLISDGNQTLGNSFEFYKPGQKLFPIIVGDTLRTDDLLISQINVNNYTNLNNQFPVEVFVQYQGEQPVSRSFRVLDQNKVVFEKMLSFSASANSQRLQFNLPATKVGMQRYAASIATLNNEKNTVNNRANFSIEVIDEQAEIYILSKLNHPDLSMFKRSIEQNKQRKVSIFNDFNQNIDLNKAQLIILYQPDQRFKELFEKINVLKTNIFIITGTNTNWRFLNDAQTYFKKNSIGKIEQASAEFNENYSEFITEDLNFSDFPPLDDMFGEIEFSVPYKTLLFQNIAGFKTEVPMLATISGNEQRIAVLFGEQSWKWRMLNRVEEGSFEKFDAFFSKLIQYLSSNVRSRQLEIEYKPFAFSNSTMLIKAQYFDATYTFDPSAQLVLDLRNTNTNKTTSLAFSLKNKHFEVKLEALDPGDYTFVVRTQDRLNSKAGAFTMLDYAVEKQFSIANVKDLRQLAQRSNGKAYFLSNTAQLIDNLAKDKQFSTIQRSSEKMVPLIDWKWLLAAILFFLSLEWFIRKYKGLI